MIIPKFLKTNLNICTLQKINIHRSNHPFLEIEKPIIMAHRGGQGLYPANTLYAFERSISLGVDVLELDLQITADGVIVIRHDPDVNATTNGSGFIDSYSLKELKELDAGYRWTGDEGKTFPYRGQGITIPTLEEILALYPDTRLNIDIKPKSSLIVNSFCQLLRKYRALERVMVGSFHDEQLYYFRKLCPETATAAGVSETRLFFGLSNTFLSCFNNSRAEAFQIPEYACLLHIVTPRFIQNAHKHNMQVHVWTVNSIEDMRRLLDWGVDGIITDYPDRALSVLVSSK